MKTIITIVSILIWQSSFAQNNNCTYNQLDSNGKEHGPWIIYRATGENSYIHAHGEYKHGLLADTWHYWRNGFLIKKETYNSGIVNFTEYFGNNQPKVIGGYSFKPNLVLDTSDVVNPQTGKMETIINEQTHARTKTGTWKYYSKDGKLERVETY